MGRDALPQGRETGRPRQERDSLPAAIVRRVRGGGIGRPAAARDRQGNHGARTVARRMDKAVDARRVVTVIVHHLVAVVRQATEALVRLQAHAPSAAR